MTEDEMVGWLHQLSLSKLWEIIKDGETWYAPLSLGILQASITGVGCRAIGQGIFVTHGSNPYLFVYLHWQIDSVTTSATSEALYSI